MAELCRWQMLELACSAKAAKLAALQPTATLYGNVLEPRARSYYCLPQNLLCHIWALRRDAESRAANDRRKMTKDCAAAVQKALLLWGGAEQTIGRQRKHHLVLLTAWSQALCK